MILITGITGGLGSEVMRNLLNKLPNEQLVGLTRNPEKAKGIGFDHIEIRQGDYLDYKSLKEAFKGIDKLLLISAPAFTDGVAQHFNVIDAAKDAGAKHIYYTSILRKENVKNRIPYVTRTNEITEHYLAASQLQYTIIRNTFYADNLPFFLGNTVNRTGVAIPGGKGKVPFATRNDLAAAIAELVSSVNLDKKIYHLTGEKAYSFDEVALLLSNLTGSTISYHDILPETFAKRVVSSGFPEQLADFWNSWNLSFNLDDLNVVDPTLERLLGRKPTSLENFLSTIYSPKNNELS